MKHILFPATCAIAASLVLPESCLAQRGPVPGINSATPYLIHYGNWTPTLVNQARTDYKLAIVHPSTSNITPADVALIRSGPDGIAGNADDVKVFAYIPILAAASAHGASLLTLSNPVADGSINTTTFQPTIMK